MSTEEVELRTLTVEGILSVQAGDNPRVVADKLTSYVPPVARNAEGDSGGASEMPQQQAEAA
jgi:chemotaxis protein MotA